MIEHARLYSNTFFFNFSLFTFILMIEESFSSIEATSQHSPRPSTSTSTLLLDSTPAPQTSALAKAEEIAAFWNSRVEEYQDICICV